MSETTSVEPETTDTAADAVQASPQILGADFVKGSQDSIGRTYTEAKNEARKVYNAATRTADEEIAAKRQPTTDAMRALTTALSTLFGSRYDHRTETIKSVANAFLQEERNEHDRKLNDAYEAADKAQRDALSEAKAVYEAELDKQSGSDPFVKFVRTVVRRDYSSHAELILDNLPATITDLNALADKYGWCSDWERVMAQAFKRGFLTDTQEYVCAVRLRLVPYALGAQEGEKWEAVVTLPGCFRPDRLHDYEVSTLKEYAVGEIVYRKTEEKPVEVAADNQPTSPF